MLRSLPATLAALTRMESKSESSGGRGGDWRSRGHLRDPFEAWVSQGGDVQVRGGGLDAFAQFGLVHPGWV